MIKKALFIVPHPDDELNIGGQFLLDLVNKGIEAFVVYTTNGDSNPGINNSRIKQAYQANKVLGVSKDHVIFLGYPDGWKGKTHIYNEANHKIMESSLGKICSNSLPEYAEFCFKNEYVHHSFTRKNLKSDLKKVIELVLPELLVCVDFDKHPDHRCASLLFDEIVGELLKEHKSYRPIVLKKFAYDGVWTGRRDYYANPRVATEHQRQYSYSNSFHELAAPCFSWDERIRFVTSEESKPYILWKNPLFKAALKHKSTNAFFCLLGIINDDIVYWWRPANNIMMEAKVSVSSGKSGFLNDFKLFDSADITNVEEPFFEAGYGCWVPDETDRKPTITVSFEQPRVIKEIDIYESCDRDNHIKKLRILANDKTVFSGALEPSGLSTKIVLQQEVKTDFVSIIVEEYQGRAMISEIEMYSEIQKFHWEEIPIGKYQESTAHKSHMNDQWLIYAVYIIRWKFPEKIRNLVSKMKKMKGKLQR